MAEIGQIDTVLDSGQQQLGAIYAKALLGATEKVGNSELALAELDAVVDDVLDKLPRLDAVLQSPRVALPEKQRMLDQAFGGKVSPQLLNFLQVVSKHGRFDCLRAIRQVAHGMLNELRGRVVASVRTAAPLGDESRRLIAARLQTLLGKEVLMREQVDTELIGGLVVRVGDTVFDGSVAQSLRRMHEEAVQHAAQEIRAAADRFASAE